MVCLALTMFLSSASHGTALAPDDSSIKDGLCLWLRSPDVNYDVSTRIWADVSGKGNNAEAVGYMAVWDNTYFAPTLSFGANPAVFSRAFATVKFSGNVDDLMRAPNINSGVGLSRLTIIAVYKLYNQSQSGVGITRPVGIGSFTGEGANLGDYFNLANDVSIRKDNGSITGATATHPDNTFFIRAARMNPTGINQWFDTDGTLQQVHTATGSSFTTSVDNFYLGDLRADNSTGGPSGYSRSDIEIAEVIVYNTDLTDAQIGGISEWLHTNVRMERKSAFAPVPEDGAMLTDAWAMLKWEPGASAVSHNVYIGAESDKVSKATLSDAEVFAGSTTSPGLTVGFPGFAYPDGLVPGTTYYWRIDEVNAADPNSPWKGDVWRFSIAPRTAYNPGPADSAGSVALDAKLTWTAGFGAKLHTVYLGEDFDDVNNAASGGATAGITTYSPASLKSAKVYYWRVDETDPPNTYKGQVWSFATAGAVGNPYPANGASSTEMNAILIWAPGDDTASHQVYFGTNKEAMRKASTTSPEYRGTRALGAESYDPGLLAWDSTYYWRIDEVNNTNPESPWKGPVWSFTTGGSLVVDDIESYNDLPETDPGSNRIYLKWIDGYGTTTNGAMVGNLDVPLTDRSNVHGGVQAMPLSYNNNLKFSEATLTLTAGKDWTRQGVAELSLWFRGLAANAPERMYVVLNGSAVVYHDNPNAVKIARWTQWTIPLQSFTDQGMDPANVTSITIGFGTRGNTTVAGGTGQMYFDDIRLYRPATE